MLLLGDGSRGGRSSRFEKCRSFDQLSQHVFQSTFDHTFRLILVEYWRYTHYAGGWSGSNAFGQSHSLSSHEGCGIRNLGMFQEKMLFGNQLSHFVQ